MNHEWVKQNPENAAKLIHELLLTQDEWQTMAEDLYSYATELRTVNSWMEDSSPEIKKLDRAIKRFQEIKSKYP